MKTYLQLLEHILQHGVEKSDRTGTGTLSVFGYQMRFDFTRDSRLLPLKNCIREVLFMNYCGSCVVIPIFLILRKTG